jgi:uncharacterized membrane protein
MEARAKLLGHAVHPMLIVFPLGLLTLTPIFDIVHMVTGQPLWAQIAFWMTICGLAGGLAAAVFGLIDWLFAVPNKTRAHRVGLAHLLVNLLAIAAFAVALAFRFERHVLTPGYAPLALDLIGLSVLFVGGWLGGELVQQHGMGVNPEAHVNAPSSFDVERLERRVPITPTTPIEPHPV